MLSGMSNLEQMQKNIRTFEEQKPLNEEEKKALLHIANEMVKKIALPCTACHYCVSHCPKGLRFRIFWPCITSIVSQEAGHRAYGSFRDSERKVAYRLYRLQELRKSLSPADQSF